ncbi:serine acetyltransferase 2-like protein [Tanacetum coccineum]
MHYGIKDASCWLLHYKVESVRCLELTYIQGILLDHGTGLVIGETAVIGDRVSLMQGVTLGGSGKETGDRHPKVGEGALIGASVTVLGNIKIGEGAMIASGSLVLKDIPQHSMAAGIPAKVIGYVEEQVPSLTMKHDASKDFFEHVAVTSTFPIKDAACRTPIKMLHSSLSQTSYEKENRERRDSPDPAPGGSPPPGLGGTSVKVR